MAALRIGVLGAGHLGRIHIQQLKEIAHWELIGFHDPLQEKCERITAEFGIKAYPDPFELMGQVDAIDIVTPTITHHKLACEAMEKGLHVFIEKPLANTLDEAADLVAKAARTGSKVQVGHVERFNPAFEAARPHLVQPMFIETHRLAQFNPRGTDVSVVLDLMIHDLDIVLHVVNSPIKSVHASGVAVVSDTPDIANARLAFENGCVANLTASRISLKNMRRSRFFQRDAYIAVDMYTKEAEIVRMRTVEGEPDPFAVTLELGEGKGMREISFEKPEVKPTNAIREELRSFAEAILNDRRPVVDLGDGYEAMRIAHRVLAEMEIQNSGPRY